MGGGGPPWEPENLGRCPCGPRERAKVAVGVSSRAPRAFGGGGVFSRRAVAELTGDPRGLCGSVYHVVACKWSLVRPNCDLGP